MLNIDTFILKLLRGLEDIWKIIYYQVSEIKCQIWRKLTLSSSSRIHVVKIPHCGESLHPGICCCRSGTSIMHYYFMDVTLWWCASTVIFGKRILEAIWIHICSSVTLDIFIHYCLVMFSWGLKHVAEIKFGLNNTHCSSNHLFWRRLTLTIYDTISSLAP
jgi:hypothetical protein